MKQKRMQTNTEQRVQTSPERVSVIVPARNEADNLKVLLPLLQAQAYSGLEIIVVDDASSDGTGEVAASLGARVILAPELPGGWLGKSWACWQGALAASGDTLVFLDADTRPDTDFLRHIHPLSSRMGGLITIQPYHEAPTAGEQWSAFFNVVLLAASGAASRLKLRTDGFGPCAICSKQDYFAAGGHEQIRGEVLEHLKLGQHFKTTGLSSFSMLGEGLLSFRMYPKSGRSLLLGWSKSIGLGAGAAPLPMLLLTTLWLSGLVAAPLRLFSELSTLDATPSIAAAMLYGFAVWTVARSLRRSGSFKWYVMLFYPVYLSFFVLLFGYSLLMAFVRKRVSWKGRQIDV